jgi:nucleotide-binding universal stress UspA family protein
MLVGLDGSTTGESAVELGIRWAKRHGALLVGIGIVDEPAIRRPEPVPLGAAIYKARLDEEQMHEARVEVEQRLERFVLRCAEAGVACKLLEDVGLPSEQILTEAQRYDLVVMGREARFRFETPARADDTLLRVIKHGPRPVVAVPASLPAGEAALVAYDGSLQAARALFAFWATGLADSMPVHVASSHQDAGEAAARADRAIRFLRAHGIEAERHVEQADRAPAAVLLEKAADVNAGLIVAGAFGQPALREFFLGSATRSLLRDGPFPMFLTH